MSNSRSRATSCLKTVELSKIIFCPHPVQAQFRAMPLRPLTSVRQTADRWVETLHLHASTGSSRGGPGHGSALDLLRKLP
jgi:hypothetical protein